MHHVVKWPNMLSKSCDVNTARLLKYVWPFYNMHERVRAVKVAILLDLFFALPKTLQTPTNLA